MTEVNFSPGSPLLRGKNTPQRIRSLRVGRDDKLQKIKIVLEVYTVEAQLLLVSLVP
jgi:hypothetical protein